MSKEMKKLKQLPGTLSFQRGVVMSDGLLYNLIDDEQYPLYVVRHGIRGTQNVNSPTAKTNVSNIQETDSARKSHAASAVVAQFSIRFLDLEEVLFALSSKDKESLKVFKGSLNSFIEKAKGEDCEGSKGLKEVARRYARNILNARWLWRNRIYARNVAVSVSADGEEIVKDLNALKVSLNNFDNYTSEELRVAEVIADGMLGNSNVGLNIRAVFDFGIEGEYEVFCSQNYIENKPKGFARSLYYVGHPETKFFDNTGIKKMGHAALRDQKINNALRTIDTWYVDFAVVGRPIPVEPIGANLADDCFYRDKKDSSFTYARTLNTIEPDSDAGMFMIASLIRGGIYSESEKTK